MNKIKQLREEKAMTQYQLGKCLNVQNTTISMYEREERQLDTPTINKLCSVLECTSDYLLGRSEVRDPIISNEDALTFFASGKTRLIVSQICASHIPHIIPSIFTVILFILTSHSAFLSASTMSIFLFFRATIHPTRIETPNISRMETE